MHYSNLRNDFVKIKKTENSSDRVSHRCLCYLLESVIMRGVICRTSYMQKGAPNNRLIHKY